MGARYAIWESQTIRQIAATGLRRVRSCTINGASAVKSKPPLGPRPSRLHRGRDARGPDLAALLAAGIGAFEHRVEEDGTAGCHIVGFGVLDLVVADAADAGDEDHRARGNTGHVDRVVAGAADDVLVRVALGCCGLAHPPDQFGVKW